MSKFLKTMAVISAMAIFISSFTACKKDDDDEDSPKVTNTGFEGKFYNINAINKLKPVSGENEIPYAQCSVAEVIFNKNGTGTYKIHQKEYYSEDGIHNLDISKDITYKKSGSTLKFTVQNEEIEFTILKSDLLYCVTDARLYRKGEIEELYAYVDIGDMTQTNKTISSKAIILEKNGSAYIKNLVATFNSFQREPTVELTELESTYTRSGENITFKVKTTGAETSGTLSVDDWSKTYLKYGGNDYRKL